MDKQEVTLNMTLPNGWEWTGEIRYPQKGESYLFNGDAQKAHEAHGDDPVDEFHPILGKLPPATLTVELPRATVEALRQLSGFPGEGKHLSSEVTNDLGNSSRAALEAEASDD